MCLALHLYTGPGEDVMAHRLVSEVACASIRNWNGGTPPLFWLLLLARTRQIGGVEAEGVRGLKV
jgi:hypothetical protein